VGIYTSKKKEETIPMKFTAIVKVSEVGAKEAAVLMQVSKNLSS
jgi:hypothetical protein